MPGPSPKRDVLWNIPDDCPKKLRSWLLLKFQQLDETTNMHFRGDGSPENVVAAPLGAIYQRLDGAAGTSFYVKETGDGLKTGWTAK